MQIKGADGYSPEMIRNEIERGGRLVIYVYCISILVMTFKRGTSVHFIRAGQSPVARGLPLTLVTLLFGWWGFPWGPIYSIECLFKNLQGGIDVTDEVLANIMPRAPASYSSAASSSSESSAGGYHNSPSHAPLPPRKPAFTLTPRFIAIGVAAIVALSFTVFAASSYHASQNLTVAVVNGLPKRTSFKINDQDLVIGPFGYQLIHIAEGDIKVAATATTPAESIHIETDFWARVFSPKIAIINPDRLALIESHNVIYTPTNSASTYEHLINWKLLTNESHYVLAEPDYVFTEAPRNHSINSGEDYYKQSRIGLLQIDAIDNRLGLIKSDISAEAAKIYATRLASAIPDSPAIPEAIVRQLAPKDALAIIEPRLNDRPLRIEWHRIYQTLAENVFPEIDLHARYAELAVQNPGDGNALYLLGRIEADPDQARNAFNRCLTASQPCSYAHIGLGYLDAASARFQDALEHYNAAAHAGLTNESVISGRREMLTALRRHDELLKEIAVRRAADPTNIVLMAEELRATANKPTTTTASLDALMKQLVALAERGTKPEEKQWVRPYFDSNLAYAIGDEAGFARSAGIIKGPRSAFEAAISRRDHVAAKLALKDIPELPLSFHLELYLVAAQKNDDAAANEHWNNAIDKLTRTGGGEKLVADQLAGRTPINLETLRKVALFSPDKSLIFACLGLRKPEHRATLFAWSAQHNYTTDFPHLLIDSVLRSAPKTTSL